MKAMAYNNFGGPELIKEQSIPGPQPRDGELLVRVAATSINPADWKIGEGALRGMIDFPFPLIPGMDFSGTVIALGSGVGDFSVGDRVFGATTIDRLGAYAEEVAVPASITAKVPRSLPLSSAAAVPLASLTSWHAVLSPDHGNVDRGQTVLIHGGAGGTGIFAVQFAKWRGAKVIATASGGNLEFLKSIGADEVVDYRSSRFEDVAGTVDAVIDLVGGDVQARSMPLIRRGGRLASIVSLPDQALAETYGVRATFMSQARDRTALEQIAQLIDGGRVKVIITGEFAFADAAKALAKSRDGHVRAKIILKIGG